jgi:ELWxxDGT repeat protein
LDGSLWRSDGTEAGTVPIAEASPELTDLSLLYAPVIGGQVFFQGTDGEHGSELWTSDGTEEGTHPVLDINLGPEGSTPILLTQVGARFSFITEDETHGHRLWVSDGTEEGTTLLHTLSDIGEHKGIRHLTAAGNTLFFSILDGSGITQVWKSDGTFEGTSILKTLNVRSQGDPRHYQPYISVGDGKIVFSAHEEGTGVEVWTSDGTPEGTHLLVDVSPGPADSNPMLMTLVGQTLFFRAEALGIGVELWGIPASNWEGMSPMDLLEFSSYWNQRESSLPPNSDSAIFRRLNTDSDEVIDANDILEFLGQSRIGNR